MSKKRQPPVHRKSRNSTVRQVRSYAFRCLSGHTVPPHRHDWHQLIYATEGAMWVRTAQGDWVIPPNRAVWVPAGIEHSIEMTGSVFVQTLYLTVGIGRGVPTRCCVVNVSPLLRELIRHIISHGMLDRMQPRHSRLMGVLLDQIVALPTAPLELPFPQDDRARRVAQWLSDRPSHPASDSDVVGVAGASPRTVERLFLRETGMTFGRWRQQLRLLQSLRILAAGKSVTSVAFDVGYESPSAFIAAFRRFFGTTPARYFD